jgi:hypothetical protein
LSSDEKNTYKQLGEQVARIHKELFPNYKYQPKRDRAAWKHYVVPNETNSRKPKTKGKSKVKQQQRQEKQEKPLEIMTNFQPQQLNIPTNADLSFSLAPEAPIVPAIQTTDIPADGFPFDEYTTEAVYNFSYSDDLYNWNI